MSPCCSGCSKELHAEIVQSTPGQVEPVKPESKLEPGFAVVSGCQGCSETACTCNDSCLEKLARAICADDDERIHGLEARKSHEEIGAAEDMSECKDDNSIIKDPGCCSGAVSQDCGLRKRKISNHSVLDSEKACNDHISLVRTRYKNEFMTTLGCICKAMLARGLQSCCSPHTPIARSIHASISNQRSDSARSRASVDSCCGDGTCQGEVQELRWSISSCCSDNACEKNIGTNKQPTGSCCASGCCPKVDIGEVRSVTRRSRVSVDSCCADSCCQEPPSSQRDVDVEKRSTISESIAAIAGLRCTLAVKGMTCTGCEHKLVRVLQALPVVDNIKASFVLRRAEFDYVGDQEDLEALIHTIENRTGFTFEQIASASSARTLELITPLIDKFMAMSYPAGVVRAMNINKSTVRVMYNPRIIGAREVLSSYEPCSPTLASEPKDPALTAGAKHIQILLLRTTISAVLTIPVLVLTWAPLPPHPRAYAITSLVLGSIVQIGIAGPFYSNAFKSLVFSGLVEVDLLVVLSTTTAYIYSVVAFVYEMIGHPLEIGSFFETSTLLVTLIVLGQLASALARQRAIAAISLRSLQQPMATIISTLPDGRTQDETIDVRLLQYGDTFRVLPDSVVITDGTIFSGVSTVDESMMTGEAVPVEKTVGHTVLAGTHNGGGNLLVHVARLPGENTISDIANMVDDARFSRARIQSIVDRVCAWFVPCVIVLTVIVFTIWIVIGIYVQGRTHGQAAVRALTYAIAVLAISCPCAIGLAVPMVVLMASGVSARLGFVFKAATTIESARQVTHAVFDKTGTLTVGQLDVVESIILQDTILYEDGASIATSSVVSSLISASKHPVARSVAAYLGLNGELAASQVQDVEEVISKGVQGTLSGRLIRGGNAKWLNLENNPHVAALLERGFTIFAIVYHDAVIAVFGLVDNIRPEVPALLISLAQRKVKVSIISGDHYAAVYRVASALCIPTENFRAGCLPADKAEYIRNLQGCGEKVLFCGDGTNDSVALAQADIGVHMPSEASVSGAGAAAAAASDAVLIRPSLDGISVLLGLSDAVYKRIMLNFAWAAVYNTVAILFAAGAFVNARIAPAYAGLGEIVSVLPVVLVAMQLKWYSV